MTPNADALRTAMRRWLGAPDTLTEADLDALAARDARWRDRALERRAAAQQAAAAPPKDAGAAFAVRMATLQADLIDLVVTLMTQDVITPAEFAAVRDQVLDLEASRAARAPVELPDGHA